MLEKGEVVIVYDGDLVGWTIGELKTKYNSNKWSILTKENSSLVRNIKEEYTELKNDGCGYVITDDLDIRLSVIGNKLNFSISMKNQ